MNDFDSDRFGVTLVLLDCAFSAELNRDTLEEVMEEIDYQLTEGGVPSDAEARIEIMMDNAITVSSMVANEDIERYEGVADIAYSFVYALAKSVGVRNIASLRGMTASYVHNVLALNPCLGDQEYQQETAVLQDSMVESQDGGWELLPAPRRTLH